MRRRALSIGSPGRSRDGIALAAPRGETRACGSIPLPLQSDTRIAGTSQTLDLAEARLLRAARRGEPAALAALWDGVVDELWSLAAELLPEDAAIEALAAVREGYGQRAPGLPLQPSWRDQVMGLLWGEIADRLEPRALAGILKDAPPLRGPTRSEGEPSPQGAQARVRRAIREAPLELRMVYLFSTLGGQNAASMAAYSGFAEGDIRAARARVAWEVVRAMKGET